MCNKLAIVFIMAMVVSCTAPLKKGTSFSTSKAYIIVGLKGNMPITEARNCNLLTCGSWHSFGTGEEQINGVHVFPKKVGGTFTLNTLHSNSSIVNFEGKIIKLEKAGVYYFGLIQSQDGRLLYKQEPDAAVIKNALLKYGESLSVLTPIGFDWPKI